MNFSTEVLNRERARNILTLCQHEEFVDFCALFESEFDRNLTELYRALEAEDGPRRRFLAHKMKSSAANLGAVRLSDQVRLFDVLEWPKSRTQSLALWQNLRNEYEQVRHHLKDFLTESKLLKTGAPC